MMGGAISGAVHIALCTQQAGHMPAIRKQIWSLLSAPDGFEILFASPRESADTYREAVYEEYLPVNADRPGSLIRRYEVEFWMNGDLQAETPQFVQPLGRGMTFSRREILGGWRTWLRHVCPRSLKEINKGRWNEIRESLQSLGVLLKTHGLWKKAFLSVMCFHQVVPRAPGALALEDLDAAPGACDILS